MESTDISFASLSFDSSTCSDIICGSNGLPITPNSIRMIGNFKAQIQHVVHPNLIRYVDCFRNKEGKYILLRYLRRFCLILIKVCFTFSHFNLKNG